MCATIQVNQASHSPLCYFEMILSFSYLRAGAIITTAECPELGSCVLLKQGKITQNLNTRN